MRDGECDKGNNDDNDRGERAWCFGKSEVDRGNKPRKFSKEMERSRKE